MQLKNKLLKQFKKKKKDYSKEKYKKMEKSTRTHKVISFKF